MLCSITRCAKLFEVQCQRKRGETSFEDGNSLVGTRVRSLSPETWEAGCGIADIFPLRNLSDHVVEGWSVMHGTVYLR